MINKKSWISIIIVGLFLCGMFFTFPTRIVNATLYENHIAPGGNYKWDVYYYYDATNNEDHIGPYLRDVKYYTSTGSTTGYHPVFKWINVPWIYMGNYPGVCGLYQWRDKDPSQVYQYGYNNGDYHMTFSYSITSSPCSTGGGASSVYITYDLLSNAGQLNVQISSTSSSSGTKQYPLYLNPDISDSTSEDTSTYFTFMAGASDANSGWGTLGKDYLTETYETAIYGDLMPGGANTAAEIWSEMPFSGNYAYVHMQLDGNSASNIEHLLYADKCNSDCTQGDSTLFTNSLGYSTFYNHEENDNQKLEIEDNVINTDSTTTWTQNYYMTIGVV